MGTLAGKFIVGTVAMAATVGALHTAGAVDLPILPDGDQPTGEPAETGNDRGVAREDDTAESQHRTSEDPRDEDGGPGQRHGQGQGQGPAATNRSSNQEYRDKVQDWSDCVAAAQSEPSTRGRGPEAVCGPKPDPADFGLSEDPGSTPGKGADAGSSNGDDGERVPDQAPVPDEAPVPDPVPPGSGTAKGQGSDPPGAGSGSANRGTTGSGDTAPGKLDSKGPRSPAESPSS